MWTFASDMFQNAIIGAENAVTGGWARFWKEAHGAAGGDWQADRGAGAKPLDNVGAGGHTGVYYPRRGNPG